MAKNLRRRISNSRSRPFSATLMMLVVCFILCISMASAWEWDNKKNYNPNTKEVTIENALGLGNDVAKIKLTTPLNVQVPRGYQKVAEFDLTYYMDNNGGLNVMKFYDIKNSMNEINREFDYKIKIIEEVIVNDYETICEDNKTGSGKCTQNLIGTHTEEKITWNDFNKNDLKKSEQVTIGIFTDVQKGDVVEWIPTFYGVEIEEWAAWTESLNVDLTSYYKLDETSGTDVYDATGTTNGTNTGATVNQAGKIGTAYLFGSGDDITMDDKVTPIGAKSISFWFKAPDNPSTTMSLYSNNIGSDSSGIHIKMYLGTIYSRLHYGSEGNQYWDFSSADATYDDDAWHHVVFTWDGTTGAGMVKFYFDGNSAETTTSTGTESNTPTNNLFIGENPSGGEDLIGLVDEVGVWGRTLSASEITDLYNSGDGITYREIYSPEITLNSPINNYNSTSQTITFNCSAYDDENLINVSLYINGTLNETNSSGINNTDYIFTRTLDEGNWNWTCSGTDNESQTTTADYRNFLIDSINPEVTITYPTTSMGYGTIGENETLNWTATDTNLDTCWYEYNNTNTTVTCGDNTTEFILVDGFTNIIFYANDSVGNENSSTRSWSYNLTENSQTYPSTSAESATETYITNLTYPSSTFSIITAKLTLNGTEYTGTRTGSGNNAIFTANAIMPSITTETNFTSYWTVDLTDVSGTTQYNLTSHNVTVSIINLSLCGSPHNVSFWNFTILNESNSAEINSTFEATFTVKTTGSTTENEFSYSDTTENNSQFDFCISPSTENYTIDTNIKLTKSGFVDKFYNFEEVAVTNSTREDNLYMMATEDSTSFIIHVVDGDGTDRVGVEVRIQRYYTGTGTWATTEIVTTNDDGEAIGHLLSEDADYRFHVYEDGVSIYNSTSTKIICPSSPCTVTLIIPLTSYPGYEDVENLDSTLTFSSTTNVFTYTYSDSSGIFSLARLYVIRTFPSNGTLNIMCNTTKATADGVITCNIGGGINGTYRASGYITRTDDDEFLDKRIDGVLGTSIYSSIGADGILWGIFLIIGVVMIGINRPSLAIIFGTLGLIFLSILGLINIGTLSITAVTAIAIILLFRVGRE